MASHATRWLGVLGLGLGLGLGCGPAKLSGSGSETGSSTDPSTDGDGDPGSTDGSEADDTAEADEGVEPEPFVPESDVPFTSCDMFAQDCPEGDKCVPDFSGWGDFRCVPVLGDRTVGESCLHGGQQLGTDDCDADSHCWLADEDGIGLCIPFCRGIPDNPGDCDSGPGCEGYDCYIYGQVGIPICEPRCDPLADDECPDGLGCSLDYRGFRCWVLYEPVPVGEPCQFGGCDPGSMCLDGTCAPYCDLSDPEAAAIDCASLPGTVCVDMLDAPDVGCSQVGLCRAP